MDIFTIDKKTDLITLKFDSNRILRAVLKILGHSKAKLLFKEYKSSYIFNETIFTFYNLFALEVYELFNLIATENKYQYGVDLKAIEKALIVLKKETWIYDLYNETTIGNKLDYKQIDKLMKFKILDHQQKAFDFYNKAKFYLGYKGALLDLATGSGKTFTSLAIAETMNIDKIIIICPLPTVDRVWIDSLENTIYKKPQKYFNLQDGKKYNNEKFILCHYEAMNKLLDIINDIKGNIFIIVDESHNFADLKSNRTILLKEVIDKSRTDNTILMSGTPIKARAKEVINVMEILDPKFKNHVKDRFVKLYKGLSGFLDHTLAIRYRAYNVKVEKTEFDLPELTTIKLNVKLKDPEPFLLKTIKEEVKIYAKNRMKYFKDNMKYYETLYFTLYKKAKELAKYEIKQRDFIEYEKNVEKIREVYKQRKLMFFGELLEQVNKFEKTLLTYLKGEEKKQFKEAKTVYKYVALKIIGETLSNVIGKKREECHTAMVLEIDFRNIINTTDAKTVIFSKYINTVEACKKKIIKDKYKPLCVYGEHTKNLSEIVESFTNDKKYNPLIATYQSLSTGVPLIAANIIIGLDLPYMSYQLDQAIARVVRIGQTRPCFFYYLTLDTGEEPNINSRNIDINKINNQAVEEITGYSNINYLEESEEINNKFELTIKPDKTIDIVR